jgi:membrane protein insertase Oxa1/YidC/SpoIIIJ
MDLLQSLYQVLLVQPLYNVVILIYTVLAKEQAGITYIIVGLMAGLLFLPTMIAGFFDVQRTKDLQEKVNAIKAEIANPTEQEQRILKLLKKNSIRFQSESVYLFGQTIILGLLYPIAVYDSAKLEPSLLYPLTIHPAQFRPMFLGLNLSHSSATLSLIPCMLLFFELRQSYREQSFLTSFTDRWYPVILPLFVYFLIFWMPSSLSLVLVSSLLVSLYVRGLLTAITTWRVKRR